MNVLIIDGQGGNIGRRLAEMTVSSYPDASVTVVGTNSAATANMLKAGNVSGATGENAVLVGCRRADIITGPIGIVVADALLGEVTPKMAAAVGQSDAVKVLIPMNRCETLIAGVDNAPLSSLLDDAMKKIGAVAEKTLDKR